MVVKLVEDEIICGLYYKSFVIVIYDRKLLFSLQCIYLTIVISDHRPNVINIFCS